MRLLTTIAFLAFTASAARCYETTSPDDRVSLVVTEAGDGIVTYSIALDGETLIEPSPLGLKTSSGDFTRGVKLSAMGASEILPISYALTTGKRSQVDKTARESRYALVDSEDRRLTLVARVSNDGVAFRYEAPGAAPAQVTVSADATTFALPSEATGFLHPMAKAKTGWSRTQPSYEEHYSIDQPVGQPSPLGEGWCFPALFKVGDRGWVLISETGVDGGYCGTHLAHESPNGKYRIALPQPEGHTGAEPIEPVLPAGGATPWRTIVIGKTLAPIVESTMATDYVEPLYESEGFRPGRSAWSWLVLKDGRTTPAVQREFVDMAAKLGWEYLLIDALWDQQIGREEIAKIAEEARQKGVAIQLWYNSNGPWNDAPQSPKDRMHTASARAEEMAWLQEVGVKSIKVDFFAGDKQATFQLYDAILRDADKHGIAVNFHGATLPRGWQRMYPNFATDEAVRGMEYCTFNQADADAQPVHCAILPFTRNAVAPMDFTPVIASERLGSNRNDGPRRRTRLSYELALPVIFFSPITHFGITPSDVEQFPEVATDYLRGVPTVWDETRYIAGYPGKTAVLARRRGQHWWVAGINATDEPVQFELPPWLGDVKAWRSVDDAGFNQVTEGTGPDNGRTTMPANGGVVMWSE